MRRLLFCFVTTLCLGFSAAASAQVTTPTVYLNEKVRLAQLAIGQRATLRFDLRPIGGQHLAIKLYRHDQLSSDTPVREWVIHQAVGQERLNFAGLPRAVYTLIAFSSDAQGEPLAEAAPLVHVEYGGWRAWEAFQPPIEVVETPPPAFHDVDVATNIRNQDVQIGLDPPAVVLRPGQEIQLKAGFHNTEPVHLKWKLVGEGTLKAIDDYHYLYTAPAGQVGSKLFRVEIQSSAHPELTARAMIMVTNADPETLNSP